MKGTLVTNTFLTILLFSLVLFAESDRTLININDSWKFIKDDVTGAEATDFDDSNWDDEIIPHCWNKFDGHDGGDNYYRGVGWYRKTYTIPNELANKEIFIQFDGVNIVSDLYVNGTHIGQHKGGYARFTYRITDHVTPGTPATIAVKVDNSWRNDVPPLSADFTMWGGIYRDVHLLVTNQTQITPLDFGGPGVYAMQENVSATTADLSITIKTANYAASSKNITAKATLYTTDNSVVDEQSAVASISSDGTKDFTHSMTLSNPHLWNGKADPYVYKLVVELLDGATVIDAVTQPVGFRFYHIDANSGFHLNGQHMALYGVNVHQDFKNQGNGLTQAHIDTNFMFINEIDPNMLRLAHYQHPQYTYNKTDSLGYVVWAEVPLVNHITESTAFYDNTKQQLKELIRQNYNHPSILFWSIYNEVTLREGPNPNALVEQLAILSKVEDPSRMNTSATMAPDADPVNWYSESLAFNKYFGWYYNSAHDFGPWTDTFHTNYPAGKMGISEYGVGSNVNHHEIDPAKPEPGGQWHPEEYQNFYHETYYEDMIERPFIWCTLIWAFFDFGVDNRDEGAQPGVNDKGLITYDRKIKKDAFYFYKAHWSEDPFVYITSRRFTMRENATVPVKVYSNSSSVELFVNGESQGSKTSTNKKFSWSDISIPLKDNMITVVGTDNGSIVRDSISWGYINGIDTLQISPTGATASTAEVGNEAGKSIDGSNTTRWAASDGTYPQWLAIDLGEAQDIGEVRIKWYGAGENRQYQYTIEVSDSESADYATIVDRSNNSDTDVISDMLNTNGRYIRITCTGVIPDGWVSLYEVKIYEQEITLSSSVTSISSSAISLSSNTESSTYSSEVLTESSTTTTLSSSSQLESSSLSPQTSAPQSISSESTSPLTNQPHMDSFGISDLPNKWNTVTLFTIQGEKISDHLVSRSNNLKWHKSLKPGAYVIQLRNTYDVINSVFMVNQ